MFESRLRHAYKTSMYMRGQYTAAMEGEDTVDRINRELVLKNRFKHFYPILEDEEI